MRSIGTTWRATPAASNSPASGEGAGRAMWKVNSSRGRLRARRRSAWSEPARSATGCTERILMVRVAVNVEQLLQDAPGGIGRYTAELGGLLPAHQPAVHVVPFVARRPASVVEEAFRANGLAGTSPVVLALPRPVLYDCWHVLGIAGPV